MIVQKAFSGCAACFHVVLFLGLFGSFVVVVFLVGFFVFVGGGVFFFFATNTNLSFKVFS